MAQLRGSGELLKKVYFPAWTPVLGATIVQTIQGALELVVLMAMFIFLGNIGLTWLWVIPILLSVVLFAQGIGLVLAVLNARFGDIQFIVPVFLGALYFLTPILYPLSFVQSASPLAASIVQSHPMTWFVEAMHDVMYSLQAPGIPIMLGLMAVGFGTFTIGLAIFNRYSRNLRVWL